MHRLTDPHPSICIPRWIWDFITVAVFEGRDNFVESDRVIGNNLLIFLLIPDEADVHVQLPINMYNYTYARQRRQERVRLWSAIIISPRRVKGLLVFIHLVAWTTQRWTLAL